MQLDPTQHSSPSLPRNPSLKRSYSSESASLPLSSGTRPSGPPSKLPKVSASHTQMRSASTSYKSHPRQNNSRPGRGFAKRPGKEAREPLKSLPQPDDPVHDQAYLQQQYNITGLKEAWAKNPKSPVSNFCSEAGLPTPNYVSESVYISGTSAWRTTVEIDASTKVIGIGDAVNKKESSQLAALSALYQLHSFGLLANAKKVQPPASSEHQVTTLSDGTTVIDYERARQFMDYYTRRYNFGKPDITYNEIKLRRQNSTWEAVMHVNGRKIGIGSGITKKAAQTNCYIDVTQYLESCDADLWKDFEEASKTGKDLGMAPKVLFQMSDGLEDEVRDLCIDIRKSALYQNAPSSTSAAESGATVHNPVYRAPLPHDFIANKSKRLSDQRQAYLNDPLMEKMRNTRATLPVYTRSEDLLEHVRQHEVTILMAATGSGKTTQIPQIILDDAIERGEGAKCNIVCTQPRRIAAISVADRVAKERGEQVGRGSVGYQVRFEHKPPDEHGSITFCTTGIFLKRMQTALQEGSSAGGFNLDDVTHIIVDEVHERDVDTDLLLVVLKRLLADRKARGKPIKVILMSATIDPTLFRTYFPDETGAPASVIEIPGRSFPVEKHFLDEFVKELPQNSWVFNDRSVVQYLGQELHSAPAIRNASAQSDSEGDSRPEQDLDLPLPLPLIGLTIAHVMQKTKDGHVLVFLPGWEDIAALNRIILEQPLGLAFNDKSKYAVHLLHSSIPVAEQQAIFEPPPEGVRRIILATNIAETSVTIPDVVYVVDSAKVKEQRYDPQRHMSSLVSAWVGTSNLNQRAGRAGRHRPGEYYGILGQKRANELHPHQLVEMKRVDLTNVVMHVKALDFPGMAVEDVLAATIEPPSTEQVAAAMNDLKVVGAIDSNQNLTPLGRVLLQIPVEVQVGRLVLFGSFFRCLDQALTLAALMTNRDPFVSPMHLKAQSSAVKQSWTPQEFRSDTFAALQAYNQWWAMQSKGEFISANRFCSDNFLSKPTLLMVDKIKRHLLEALVRVGVVDVSAGGQVGRWAIGRGRDMTVPPELNSHGDSQPLLAALIAVAMQPKFAIQTGERSYRTQQDKMVFIHPSSVNSRKRGTNPAEGPITSKQIIAYAEKRQNISAAGANASNAQTSLVTTTLLDPMTYVLFGAYRIEVTERGLECDDWLPIVGNVYALDDIQRLKYMMEACMSRVFQGLIMKNRKQPRRNAPPVEPREEEESGDEDDESTKDLSLSEVEIRQLDFLTRDIVRVLNRYAEERIATQSRSNSRPVTPMGSPSLGGQGRLPQLHPRSGASSPYPSSPFMGPRSAFNSRPSTPSRLSSRISSMHG